MKLVGRARRFASPGRYNNDRAHNYHRDRQQRTHGDAAPEKAELRVGFAEMLAGDAGQAIKRDETAEDQARPFQRAEADHHRQNDKQQNTFEPGLVELAWMARQRAAVRKDHRPGQGGIGGSGAQPSAVENWGW